MTRTDNTTKAIACRVPMQDYIKFLTEASNKNMSLSEWLLVKVYSSGSGRPGKVEPRGSNNAIDAKQKEINDLKGYILLKDQENKNFREQINSLYQHVKQNEGKVIGEDLLNYMKKLIPSVTFN